MCLIVFKYQPDEDNKLVLAANRDEYYQRKAIPAKFWPEQPNIFGGIDAEAGGSWLSVDTSGRLAVLTNIRKPPYKDSTKLSRGYLVKDFLSQQYSVADFIKQLENDGKDYGLFNLLLLDSTGLWHYSNDSCQANKVIAGTHGLSNASLNTPWPKLTTSVKAFENSLVSDHVDTLNVLNTMQSRVKPADDELPDTGIGIEFERFLSPIFIQGEEYGTRCTTLLTISKTEVNFTEVSYSSVGQISGEVQQKINL